MSELHCNLLYFDFMLWWPHEAKSTINLSHALDSEESALRCQAKRSGNLEDKVHGHEGDV